MIQYILIYLLVGSSLTLIIDLINKSIQPTYKHQISTLLLWPIVIFHFIRLVIQYIARNK